MLDLSLSLRTILVFIYMCCCGCLIAQNNIAIAENYAQEHATTFGIHPDIEWRVSDVIGNTGGISHVYLQQTYQNIDVEGSMLSIHLKNNEVMYASGNFIAKIRQFVGNNSSRNINSTTALQNTLNHLSLSTSNVPMNPSLVEGGATERTFFDLNDIAYKDVKAELVYTQHTPKDVRLTWDVELSEKDTFSVWSVRVDANTGNILHSKDLVLNCDFGTPDACANTPAHKACSSHTHNIKTKNTNTLANSYTVIPYPIESPNHGSFSIVTNPAAANTTASPLGWHNDGNTTYTTTQGNNVLAQEDIDADDGTGIQADGGASLDFNFTFNPEQAPRVGNNLFASITNLFYWNNIMHDIFYNYGFDEESGNYQNSNFGRGGAAGDFVIAEAQDGVDKNNATFFTSGDGESPRMQMYLWDAPVSGEPPYFRVTQPSTIAGDYGFLVALFGPSAFEKFGNLVLVDDPGSSSNEACSAPANAAAISGNIALIDRGGCEFGTKVLNAENAGATAAIVCNNDPNGIVTMGPGAVGNNVTIPAIMINQADCALIRARLPNVTVAMKATVNLLDGDFDSGIIAHEYGHGITIRLTGGRNNAYCLVNEEQMGEGWSDFFGLCMTTDPSSHNADTPRGVGTYALSQPPTGSGIRPFPYSRDMSVNPVTYADVANTSFTRPHGIGSIWCSMIWDLYWNLVDDYGYDTDLYNGTGGNNVAMRLVTEACKFQPCLPGFVDGRDAILAADEAIYNGANQCAIWDAFARRGLGYSANQGSSGDRFDGVEAFDLPPTALVGINFAKTASQTEVSCGDVVTFTVSANTPVSLDCIPLPSNINVQDILPHGMSYVNGSASNGGSESGGLITWPTIPNFTSNINYTYQALVDCANIPRPTPATVIDDEVENGINPLLSTSNFTSLSNWQITNSQSFSGTRSWYAEELESFPATQENQYLTIGPFMLQGPSELSFQHLFDTENTWDGGQIEISLDNGISWQDLGDDITQNGYNSYIANNSANLAFSGLSNGNASWIETKVDLSNYENCIVLVRFNFYYDAFETGLEGNNINDGWYVDDIKLTTKINAALLNKASLTGGGDTFDAYTCIELNTVAAAVKVVLKGSHAEGASMNNDLADLLPTTEPYTDLGFMHISGGGNETIEPQALNLTGGDAIVDWVIVELRDPSTPSTVVATRSALVQVDGDVVDMDGKSSVSFYAPAGNYHVAVRHRNHLGVMTAAPLNFN